MKTGIELITEERQRQIEVEGYDEAHDAKHNVSEFIKAANSYVQAATIYSLNNEDAPNKHLLNSGIPFLKQSFVWGSDAFKSTDCLKDLIKAGALIAAAIDRLQKEQ